MGEVYRARDPRLNRSVALKILPAGARLDAERRERFAREAQTIAALNHPGIVTIYSIEEDAGTTFLTMELVEGRPLSELLAKGALPLARLARIGVDIADAIAAAHQKGITHRDLKPANIMIGDGDQADRIKVLDFGLAKLEEAARASGQADIATALQTGEGRILGTVAYMSPEQAEGKAVDARSDLFSLGIILYEMATGRRPFTGETSVSILASIVKDTPASVSELNPALPRDFARIVRRALAKDPEARYQTAKDLRNDLRELRASLESGELTVDAAANGPGAHRRSVRMWQALAMVAVLSAIVASALLIRRAAPPAAPTVPATAMTRLTSGVTAGRAVLSPDGKFVAYVQTSAEGRDSVWVRQIATGSNVQIVAEDPDVGFDGLTVTPDGAFVDVLKLPLGQRAGLWRVPLLGGPARKIVDEAESAPGWSPDGRHMAYVTRVPSGTERSVVVADPDGGNARVVATRTLPLRYPTVAIQSRPDVRPVWTPDGRAIIVAAMDERTGNRAEFVSVDVATGAETPLPAPATANGADLGLSLAMGADGASVLATVSPEPHGPLQIARLRLADGATTWLTADLAEYESINRAGDTLVATRTEVRKRLSIGDAAGREFRAVGSEQLMPERGDSRVTWADATRVLYAAPLPGGSGVWSTDVHSGSSQLLVRGDVFRVVETADGGTIIYDLDRGAWRAASDGTHPTRLPHVMGASFAVAPDGSALFYLSGQSGLQTAWKTDLAGNAPHQFVDVQVRAEGIAVSPDSRWVALLTAGPGRAETLVLPAAGGAPVRHLPPAPSPGLEWTPDGQALAYRDASLTNLWIQPIDGSPARPLTHFTDQSIFAFGWSPDGKQLALWRGARSSDIVLLKNIK